MWVIVVAILLLFLRITPIVGFILIIAIIFSSTKT